MPVPPCGIGKLLSVMAVLTSGMSLFLNCGVRVRNFLHKNIYPVFMYYNTFFIFDYEIHLNL